MISYILVHGLGQGPSSWEQVITHISTQVKFHQPCLSTIVKEQTLTYDHLYQGFQEECNKLESPLYLCGLSLGAVLALQYTLEHPQTVKNLILIAPQYKMPTLLLQVQAMLFRFLPGSVFQTTGFSKQDMITISTSIKHLDFTSHLHQITCPCHIICGQKDKANKKAAKQLANLIPHATLTLVDGAGHEVNIDAPLQLANEIKTTWFSVP